MANMFREVRSFNGDISKWNMSSVKDMSLMFFGATSFDGDQSKWDVSSVKDMSKMLYYATSFTQKLCTTAWVHSKARKDSMFEGSSGSISQVVCTAPHLSATTLAARQSVPRQTHPERELIAHILISTPAISPIIASTSMCPKCGTFVKSGRVSCCAPGGAWYENCGGAGNRNVDHTLLEGTNACKRKFKATCM